MNKIYKNGQFILRNAKIMLVTLSSIMTISGCYTPGESARYSNTGGSYDDYKTEQTISANSVNSVAENYITSEVDYTGNISMSSIGNQKIVGPSVSMSVEDYESFKLYLRLNPVNYRYSQIYNFDAALNEYNSIVYKYSHDNKLNEITVDSLYNIVLENNKNYLGKSSVRIYKELEDSKIREICEIIVPIVNEYLNGNHGIDEDNLKCVLSNLKILANNSAMVYAYVSDDNSMIIAPKIIKIANNDSSYEENFRSVVCHETMHLLQQGCPCVKENNEHLIKSFGFLRKFNNLDINSLNLTWMIEASAEMNKVNYLGCEPLSYTSMIKYMESLGLINSIRDDYNTSELYDISFKQNLDDVFDFLRVSDNEEKEEVLNMLYTIEVMQQSPEDFMQVYQQLNGISYMSSEQMDIMRYITKSEACQSYSRFFYRNLAEILSTKQIPLNDVFYLMSVYEADLNYHVRYSEPDKFYYNQDLMKNYVEMQNEFLHILAKNMNMSDDDMIRLFDNYTMYVNDGNEVVNNYDLSWLSNEKISFIEKMKNQNNKFATYSLRNVYNQNMELVNSEQVSYGG